VAPPPLAAAVAAAAIPFDVTAAAQAGALDPLGASDRIQRRCAHLPKERDRLVGELRQLGYPVPQSSAWLPIGDESVAYEAHTLNFGCTVLAYLGLGVRVTVGRRPDDDLFLAAARAWRAHPAG
jgi:histidinol-phosphate aminotransferase